MSLRIGLVADTLNIGGAQTNATSIAAAMRGLGYDVFFISSGGVLEERLASCGIRKYPASLSKLRYAPRAFLQVFRALSLENPSVVHFHTPLAIISGIPSATLLGIPSVVSIHGRLDIFPRSSRYLNSIVAWFIRLVNTCSGGRLTYIAVSQEMLEYAISELGVKKEQIQLIPNGIDTIEFCAEVTADHQSEPGSAYWSIVFLGRLSPDKQVPITTILETADKLRRRGYRARFTLVGGGSLHDRVSREAARVNQSANEELVVCGGSATDVLQRVRLADLVIASGRSAMEASSFGKPVVFFSNTGYCPLATKENIESIAHTNFSGRGIQPPPQPGDFCEDLVRILTDRESRETSARVCTEYVHSNLSMHRVARKLASVYQEIAERRWNPEASMEERSRG